MMSYLDNEFYRNSAALVD